MRLRFGEPTHGWIDVAAEIGGMTLRERVSSVRNDGIGDLATAAWLAWRGGRGVAGTGTGTGTGKARTPGGPCGSPGVQVVVFEK